jgi:hypothetical protein
MGSEEPSGARSITEGLNEGKSNGPSIAPAFSSLPGAARGPATCAPPMGCAPIALPNNNRPANAAWTSFGGEAMAAWTLCRAGWQGPCCSADAGEVGVDDSEVEGDGAEELTFMARP